jgi:transcriptional antiterminator
MLELRLAGSTVEEIADSVACSERTVRRFLKELQQRFADSPSDDEPSPTEAAVDP